MSKKTSSQKKEKWTTIAKWTIPLFSVEATVSSSDVPVLGSKKKDMPNEKKEDLIEEEK